MASLRTGRRRTGTAPATRALGAGHGEVCLLDSTGWVLPLDVGRWCAQVNPCDMTVVRRCSGPVLDIGCGPGRLVEALTKRGHRALGIDISLPAVDATNGRGGRALGRSVFDAIPAEGRWGTALLLDGNIGIGGDPVRLLRRITDMVRDNGLLLVETPARTSIAVTLPASTTATECGTAPSFGQPSAARL